MGPYYKYFAFFFFQLPNCLTKMCLVMIKHYLDAT